jgi:hypothetical protein
LVSSLLVWAMSVLAFLYVIGERKKDRRSR